MTAESSASGQDSIENSSEKSIEASLQAMLLGGLNRAAHEVISVDPDTASRFRTLLGKVYCLELTLPPMTIYLLPEPDGFTLVSEPPKEPDVTLRGSIFGFAKLSGRGGANSAIGSGQVTMQGDAEAGQALQKIFARFDFDWEELIARALGDTPARKAGNAVRSATAYASQSAHLARENLGDYLVEEKRLLVGGVALERFSKAVNTLRADTDRLAQRVDRLRARSTHATGSDKTTTR